MSFTGTSLFRLLVGSPASQQEGVITGTSSVQTTGGDPPVMSFAGTTSVKTTGGVPC